MEKNNKLFELENRYCPICGRYVKKRTPLHRCSDKDIKNLKYIDEDRETQEDRTYDDKLNEFEEYYNSDTYYNKEEEE